MISDHFKPIKSVTQCHVIKRDAPKHFVFVVRLMDDRKRILERNFCAQSYEEREEWCNAFESVKLEHQRRTSFRKLDPTDLANFVDMDMIKKQNYNSVKKEDFRPIKKLGKGTFGNVFLVEYDKKYFAMKGKAHFYPRTFYRPQSSKEETDIRFK